MITKFSALYVGHIDVEDCGHSGPPANDRRYSNARLVETFETARAVAGAADALGYETLWMAEHHFQHEGYECIPNIPLLAVDLAHRTKRIRSAARSTSSPPGIRSAWPRTTRPRTS